MYIKIPSIAVSPASVFIIVSVVEVFIKKEIKVSCVIISH